MHVAEREPGKTGSNASTEAGDRSRGTAYAWYVTVVFFLFYALSFIDRQVLSVLVSPVKAELALTDLQVSYLGGISFILVYCLFGIVMGRLVDTYSRKAILWTSIVIWTCTTSLSAYATNFWHLLVMRMGVAFGESALGPSTYSMLADLFPRQRLATAISLACTGAAAGVGMAYLCGALALDWAAGLAGPDGRVEIPLLGTLTPWRVVFLLVGIPGLIMSLILFTIREPQRRGAGAVLRPGERPTPVPIPEVIAYARANWRVYGFLYLGMGFLSVSIYGGGFWDITFFERQYGWSPAQSGVYYGAVVVVMQMIGSLAGGLIADYLSGKRSRDMKVVVLAVGGFICVIFRLAYPFMPTFETALIFIAPAVFLTALPFGIVAAAIQLVSPVNLRGQMSALYALIQSLIGMGLGPTSVAFFTEVVFRDLDKIGYSIAITGTLAQSLSAVFFLLAVRPYHALISKVER